jgi:hypothetical protein
MQYKHISFVHPFINILSTCMKQITEKLIIVQLINNFRSLYGTGKFIAVFRRERHCTKSESAESNALYTLLFCNHFNIILLSNPWSSKECLSFRFSGLNCMHFSSVPWMQHAHLIFLEVYMYEVACIIGKVGRQSHLDWRVPNIPRI